MHRKNVVRCWCALLLCAIYTAVPAHGQASPDSVALTFHAYPAAAASTSPQAQLFWAGSLNRWDAGNEATARRHPGEFSRPLTRKKRRWAVTLRAPRGDTVRYRYTRGSRFSAEASAAGRGRAPRVVVADRSKRVADTIAAWRDRPREGALETWPRASLHRSDAAKVQRGGEPVGHTSRIFYTRGPYRQMRSGYAIDDRVRSVPEGLRDTALYVFRLSNVPHHNALLVLGGRASASERWRFYLDGDSDHRFAEKERLLSVPANPDSTIERKGTVQYRYAAGGRTRDTTRAVWVKWHREHPMGGAKRSSLQGGVPTLTVQLHTALHEGQLAVGDTTFSIGLFNWSLASEGLRAWHSVVIDRDGDGRYDISRGSDEFYEFRKSFALAGRRFEVASVGKHGGEIQLRPLPGQGHATSFQKGDSAPAWSGETLGGDALSSKALRGRHVLIDFWGTWCAPCVTETPNLKRADTRYDRADLAVVGIAVNDTEANVRRFVEQRGVGWPQILDPQRHIAERFNVRGVPDPVLIGPEGTIEARGAALLGEQLGDTLRKHLGQQ